jgi:hypothetical protein
MPTKWFTENTKEGRRLKIKERFRESDAVVIDVKKYTDDSDESGYSETEYTPDYERKGKKAYCNQCSFKLEKKTSRYYCKHCNIYYKLKSKNNDTNNDKKKTSLNMPQDPLNKESLVAHPPDPNESYYDKHNKNKPSGYFADFPLSSTGKLLDIVESNPKTGTTYTYHSSSGYVNDSSTGAMGIGIDRCPVKPRVIRDEKEKESTEEETREENN